MPTLIRNGRVLRGNLKDCAQTDVLIDGGLIKAIEPPGTVTDENVEPIDATDRLLVPGLVNGHTHSHGALGKGLVGDRIPLEVFLNSAGAINGNRTLEDKRLSAMLSAVELVRKGCTACYDLFIEYPFPSKEGIDAVAEAYAAVGIRAVVAPMMSDRSLFQALPRLTEFLPPELLERVKAIPAAPHETSIAACRTILENWRHDSSRIRPALAPTIPLHCSDPFLIACRDLAREFGVKLQTHLAETRTQAVVGLEKYGCSLTEHLEAIGFLGPNCSAAHGIWLDNDDIARLSASGTGVVHNPMSNLRIGSGVAPIRALLSAGVGLGIGTDASNTSDGQSMFEALRLAAYLSRIGSADPADWVSAEDAFRMATEGSAAILGFDRIGRLDPGYRADMVFLDTAHINYIPMRAPLLQVVFAENGAAIDSVMVDGAFILRHGKMVNVDETQLQKSAALSAERLDRANAHAAKSAQASADLVGHFCVAHATRHFHVQRRLPEKPVRDRRL